jgi:hypothetical protein
VLVRPDGYSAAIVEADGLERALDALMPAVG